MSIRRTSRLNQKKFLKENSNLKILDLGCTHVNYWEEANHFADIVDYSDFFKKKNFLLLKSLPVVNFHLKTKSLITLY